MTYFTWKDKCNFAHICYVLLPAGIHFLVPEVKLEVTFTLSSAITLISLTLIGWNIVVEQVKTVCVTRNFAYSFFLAITRFSATSVKLQVWMTGQFFSHLSLFLLRYFV